MNRFCFIGSGSISDNIRLGLFRLELVDQNTLVDQITPDKYDQVKIDDYSSAFVARPTVESLKLASGFLSKNKKVVIDIDDDFFSLEEDHPDYPIRGRGNPEFIQSLQEVLKKTGAVTVTSKILAERLSWSNPNILFLKNCWLNRSSFWSIPAQPDSFLHIGWYGTQSHLKDFLSIFSVLNQTILRFDFVKLVIVGDARLYKLFTHLPEDRKLFVPFMPYDFIGHVLSLFDIVLNPYIPSVFNEAKSDIKLVECGAGKKAFIASPVPSFFEYGAGGIIAKNEKDWSDALEFLITHPKEREKLANNGFLAASQRSVKIEANSLAKIL